MYVIHRNTRSLSSFLLIHKFVHETFKLSRILIGFFIHTIAFLSLSFFHYFLFYYIDSSSHLLHSFNLISLYGSLHSHILASSLTFYHTFLHIFLPLSDLFTFLIFYFLVNSTSLLHLMSISYYLILPIRP
jgi:hypothetical protein